jgi:hypothetical protein
MLTLVGSNITFPSSNDRPALQGISLPEQLGQKKTAVDKLSVPGPQVSKDAHSFSIQERNLSDIHDQMTA